MGRYFRIILQFIFFAGLSAGLLWMAFRGMSLNALKEGIKTSDNLFVILALVVGLLSYVFRAMRWQLLIQPLGFTPRLWDVFNGLMSGYLANFIFPRIGEVVRCAALSRKATIPADKLIGTVIIERVVDLLCLAIIALSFFMFRLNLFVTLFEQGGDYFSLSLERFAFIIGAVLIFLLLLLCFVFFAFRRYVPQGRFRDKIKKWVNGIMHGIKSLLHLRNRMAFLLLTLLVWMSYFAMTWLLFKAIPATSHLSITDAMFILVIGSFAFVIPAQGGIGSFHLIVSLGLTVLGVLKSDGLVYATISHSTQSVFAILIGIMSFIAIFAGLQYNTTRKSDKSI